MAYEMDTSDFFQMNMDQANIVFVKDKDKIDGVDKGEEGKYKSKAELVF